MVLDCALLPEGQETSEEAVLSLVAFLEVRDEIRLQPCGFQSGQRAIGAVV